MTQLRRAGSYRLERHGRVAREHRGIDVASFTFAAIVIAVGSTCISMHARAETYYVATDGDDANAGSTGQPFASIQCAQKSAQPGDTVYIRGGTYRILESQIAKRAATLIATTTRFRRADAGATRTASAATPAARR